MLFEELAEINDKLVYIGDKPEEFKYAILGLTDDCNHVVYSYNRLIEAFMERDGMSLEEADEWISVNVIRSLPYMGEFNPIVISDLDDC